MNSNATASLSLIADLHYNGSSNDLLSFSESLAALKRTQSDVLVLLGDIVVGESAEHARDLLREISDLCAEFQGQTYFIPGNHDLDHLSKSEFYEALGVPRGPIAFDFGGHRIVGIDTNFSPDGTAYERGNFDWPEAWVAPEALDCFEAQLAAASLPVWVVCHQRLDHETQFAVRNHCAVRAAMARAGNVYAVFQGHNHMDDFMECDGISFFSIAAATDGVAPVVVKDTPHVQLTRGGRSL